MTELPPPWRWAPGDSIRAKSFVDSLLAGAEDVPEVEKEIEAVRSSLQRPALAESWRCWFAPVASLAGCWLDRVVTVANAHTDVGAALLRLQEAFRAAYPPLPHPLPPDPDVFARDIAWLRALSGLGDRFAAAAVGVTLAHGELDGGLFALTRPRGCGGGQSLLLQQQLCRQALDVVLGFWPPGSLQWTQVRAGRALYRRRTLAWCRLWRERIGPVRGVLAMLRHKAEYGHGYHPRVRVGGRILDEWLEELAAGGGESFLDAFRDSPWVDCRHPENSRFLTKATAFGGPMFGVFSKEEKRLLLEWLRRVRDQTGPRPMPSPEPLPPLPECPAAAEDRRLPPAQLYHRLLSPHIPPPLPAARAHVERVLARARRRCRGCFPWSAERFRSWLDGLHAEACSGVMDAPYPWLSRPACRWGIEQLAPTILVDGCWLQHSRTLARELPEVGEALGRIFHDELGGGDMARHHGNVYRRLLETAGIQLPPFDSADFVRHPGFVSGAFDLPAFLLAIDRLAGDFLPEILGLNLAIEFSGLGKGYQRLALTLERVGFDPAIVRLHQSIDNLACGHAALAREAVIAWLDRFAGGEEAVALQWRRVWSGWQALAVASRRFTRHLVVGWVLGYGIQERLRCLPGVRRGRETGIL